MNSNAVAVTELLEATVSGHPRLVAFLLDVILKSPARSAVYELAAAFDVPHDEVGRAVYQACVNLDRLEKQRGAWQDPTKVLAAPNLAALLCVCYARLNRVSNLARRRRLEKIQGRLEAAHDLARSRAWIEAFIGPLPERRAQSADR